MGLRFFREKNILLYEDKNKFKRRNYYDHYWNRTWPRPWVRNDKLLFINNLIKKSKAHQHGLKIFIFANETERYMKGCDYTNRKCYIIERCDEKGDHVIGVRLTKKSASKLVREFKENDARIDKDNRPHFLYYCIIPSRIED